MFYPLTFQPIFKERVWGGRNLERLYGKRLPPDRLIGESWEISDRPGDVSVVAHGPLAGRDLRWLMQNHAADLLGAARPQNGRFPLLIKILDAREKLSLQVHPPASKADELGDEPKTEMWYIADAVPGAELFAGLKRGVTRQDFESKIRDGTVAACFHRVPVCAGDAMFLPSGRVHAIGAGLVIFEIQQNSDTTYRVFDWNRLGLDGQPRALHVAESLASMDFNDFEPQLIPNQTRIEVECEVRPLVSHPLFNADACSLKAGQRLLLQGSRLEILGALAGRAVVEGGGHALPLRPGQFCLVPAALENAELRAETPCSFLRVEAG